MASGPITSWEIDGETVETVLDFIFLGSKITADGDCSHGITPWKESCDQPRQHIGKQRHYFANKGLSSPSYGFQAAKSYLFIFSCTGSSFWLSLVVAGGFSLRWLLLLQSASCRARFQELWGTGLVAP